MKKFRYKYPVWMKIVVIAAIVLASASFTVNVYRLVKAFDYMSSAVAVVISVVAAALFSSMLISSNYTVTDKELVLNWGFLKNRFPLSSVKKIVLEQTKEKLILYYNEENFFILNARTVDYADLVDEMRKKNDKIVFEFTSSAPHDAETK